MSDFPIRWDRNKKEARDQEYAEKKIKDLVGKAYSQWKERLIHKNVHPEKLSVHLNDLRGQVMAVLKKSDLKDYTAYAAKLLDEVEARVKGWEEMQDPAKPNYFLPDVPNGQPIAFHQEKDLMELTLIADHFTAEDFCGILINPKGLGEIQLLAAFANSKNDSKDHRNLKTICLGRVANMKGVGRLPTLQEFVGALTTKGGAQASSPQSAKSGSAAKSSSQTPADSSGPDTSTASS